jgi:hypothetical protein
MGGWPFNEMEAGAMVASRLSAIATRAGAVSADSNSTLQTVTPRRAAPQAEIRRCHDRRAISGQQQVLPGWAGSLFHAIQGSSAEDQ